MIPGSNDYRKPKAFSFQKLGLIESHINAILKFKSPNINRVIRDAFLTSYTCYSNWPTISDFVALKNSPEHLSKFNYFYIVEIYREVFRNAQIYGNLNLMQYLIEQECIVNPYNILSINPLIRGLDPQTWMLQITQISLSIDNMEHVLRANEVFLEACNNQTKIEYFVIFYETALNLASSALELAVDKNWIGCVDKIWTSIVNFCNHYKLNYPKFHSQLPTKAIVPSFNGLQGFFMLDCLERNQSTLKLELCANIVKELETAREEIPKERKLLKENLGYSSIRSALCVWFRAVELKINDSWSFELRRLFYLFKIPDLPTELTFKIVCAMIPVELEEKELVINYFIDAPNLASMLDTFIPNQSLSDLFVISKIAEMNGISKQMS